MSVCCLKCFNVIILITVNQACMQSVYIWCTVFSQPVWSLKKKRPHYWSLKAYLWCWIKVHSMQKWPEDKIPCVFYDCVNCLHLLTPYSGMALHWSAVNICLECRETSWFNIYVDISPLKIFSIRSLTKTLSVGDSLFIVVYSSNKMWGLDIFFYNFMA